jgi:hypothetical protein
VNLLQPMSLIEARDLIKRFGGINAVSRLLTMRFARNGLLVIRKIHRGGADPAETSVSSAPLR